MGVTGHWRRSALGAGGVALLLPLGIALGVVLTTAFGGTATLRALGQVFAGPSAPGGAAAPGLESARDVPSVPVRARPTGAQQGASSPGGPSTTPGSSPSTGTGHPQSGPPSTPGGSNPTTPPTTPSTPPAGGGDSTPPTTPPEPSAVHQAGEQAVGVAHSVPDPVGGVAGDAMQTVVDLIP